MRRADELSLPKTCAFPTVVLVLLHFGGASPAIAQSLDDLLRREPYRELATSAKREGDAARGAIIFFQPYMACAKCHSVGIEPPSGLGPDLAKPGQETRDDYLVESVLEPSKVIRKDYHSISITKKDGTSLVGIRVSETTSELTVRDLARNGEAVAVKLSEIDEIIPSDKSIMPAGQSNQLTSRQQFYDLIRYLIEVRDGGPARARALQPSPTLLTLALPEYEQHLDHAGLIEAWDADSLKRGEAIYRRVCMNCHGTRDQPGSLPTSLRFADGKFKNGSDPYAMYQTITRGFGLMAAQTWMMPSQKYDVIHYIRETYLRPYNSTQLSAVNTEYLARLPKGDTRGPAPSKIEPWSAMDYGPTLTHTYEVPGAKPNFAYKGIAIRLDPGAGGVARGRFWSLFDTDTLRVSAVWSAEQQASSDARFIDWRGIQFNGEHQIHPHIVGNLEYSNSMNPGWADPLSSQYIDNQRIEGRDGMRYGPLPKTWARFKGLYHNENRTVLKYTVGDTEILESPTIVARDQPADSYVMLRTLNLGPRTKDLDVQVTNSLPPDFRLPIPRPGSLKQRKSLTVPLDIGNQLWGISPQETPAYWVLQEGQLRLKILHGDESLKFSIWMTEKSKEPSATGTTQQQQTPSIPETTHDLAPFTGGGPARWPQKIETRIAAGKDNGPFSSDTLQLPDQNPWLAQLRPTGLDFSPDGRMAVCTWDGDVWMVETTSEETLRWQRIASGLFQPLGLKVIDGKIYLTCRDQLCVLHDLNGDGETDFYECLNNDHQVTPHFHEFAMGLQVDDQGNFYYAKSARHALPAIVPHHGTLLRVTKDGSHTDILANGFRAANGVCLNPDGSFVVTDQEGHWNPKNRINWVTVDPSGRPKFYGNMFGFHDVTDTSDSAMEPPLCWITNSFDRSPAELLWVASKKWGPLNGALLNLSYGYGKVYVVPHERVHGVMQGGMIALPITPFPTGVMRGRFSPIDGQLYLCGMFAWAGNATQPGGLYRLRATGQSVNLPIELHAFKSGLQIVFSDPLDPNSVDSTKLAVKIWALKRTANYGSDHNNEMNLKIRKAQLDRDGKSVLIEIEDLHPTWCMEINFNFRSIDGKPVEGTIHNTIHELTETLR